MADLNDIKIAIKKLEGGKFQGMCNQILYEMGYTNYSPLGSAEESDKTVFGTPDTFFIKDDLVVQIEYTTQEDDIFNKLKKDIKKCINEFKKLNVCQRKIIIFYSSTKLKLDQSVELFTLCKEENIDLEIYNLESIANILKNEYPIIAKEYLDVSVDTLQVLSPEEYLSDYNNKKGSVKLNKILLYREDEKKIIIDSIKSNDITLVSGKSGCGKTHLILDVIIKKYDDLGFDAIYCINNKNLDLYSDLKKRFKKGKKYLIFIDDINNICDFNQIFSFLADQFSELKIIASVRDYAKKNVIEKIEDFERTTNNRFDKKYIDIGKLKLNELSNIIKTNSIIKNSIVIRNIIHVSQGNARIMMMAVDVISRDGIKEYKISEIYDKYYNLIIKSLEKESKTIMKSLAIVCLLNAVDLNNSFHCNLLDEYKLNIEQFKKDLIILHDNEIIDMISDSMAKVSEQCIANYSIYLSLIVNKNIELSHLITIFFNISISRIVEDISILFTIFGTNEVKIIIKESLRKVWNKINDFNIRKSDFLEKFGFFLDEEAIHYCKDYISEIEENKISYSFDNIIKDKNRQYSDDQILSLLENFKHTDNLEKSIDIIIEYYMKDNSILSEVFKFFAHNFGFNEEVLYDNFEIQKLVINKLILNYDKTKDSNTLYLILLLIAEYMKFSGDFSYSNGKREIVITHYSLPESSNLRDFRNLMLNFLLKIANENSYHYLIINVLSNIYNSGYGKPDNIKDLIKNDKTKIRDILNCLMPLNFRLCVLINSLNKFYKKISVTPLDIKINDNEAFSLYSRILSSVDENYKESSTHENMKKITKKYSKEELKAILLNIREYESLAESEWNVNVGVSQFLKTIFEFNKDETEFVIRFILKNNIVKYINIDFVVNFCIENLGYMNTKNILYSYDYDRKFYFIVASYSLIPSNMISKGELNNLKDFISDKVSISSGYAVDLSFISKYRIIDKNVYSNILHIIYNTYHDKSFEFSLICSLLFNEHSNISPKLLLEYFANDYDILFKTYLLLQEYRDNYDYNFTYFKMFLDIDYNKYSKLYVKNLKLNSKYSQDHNPLVCIWNYDDKCITSFLEYVLKPRSKIFLNIREYFAKHFNSIHRQSYIEMVDRRKVLNKIFSSGNDVMKKQEEYLVRFINIYYYNKDVIYDLFSVISTRPRDFRLECIKSFLLKNNDDLVFEKLQFEPNNWSWSGSEIPIIEDRIAFFNDVYSMICELGPEYNKHKEYIEKKIEYLRLRRADVARNEFLNEY